MPMTRLFRMLAQNRYQIHFTRIPMFCTAALASVANSSLATIQRLLFQNAIDRTELVDDPIFVLGHWRSGTTYVHELMSLDSRFASPTTYQCFVPSHFLVSQPFLKPLLGILLPSKRPMDDVKLGLDAPQEDEFALCNAGLPSTYLRIAFPNHSPRHLDYLNMRGIPSGELAAWKTQLENFMRLLSLHYGKQLVLKSPPHTGRLGVLKEWYPRAKFIHISRNPYQLIPSTIRLWKTLDQANAFQVPTHEGLEDFVFDCFERLYRGYHRHRAEIPNSQLIEIRYEDLIEDPLEVMQSIYARLDIGGFDEVRPRIEAKIALNRDFKTNTYDVSGELAARIDQSCQAYNVEFGHETAANDSTRAR